MRPKGRVGPGRGLDESASQSTGRELLDNRMKTLWFCVSTELLCLRGLRAAKALCIAGPAGLLLSESGCWLQSPYI